MTDLAPFLEATIRTATPLLLASLGETVSQRAGVLNIGLEGCIIAGAYAAYVTSGSPAVGYAAAVGGGLAMGIVFVVFALLLRRDQVIVGTALTMLGLGVTGTMFRAQGQAGALVSTESVLRIPLLADIPVVGGAFFAQPSSTYLALALVPAVWWWLQRTHHGLAVRATGEAPDAARSAGVRVLRVQVVAVLFSAALGGLAGGALVVAQAGTFAEGMSSGRGFLAIAIVALGRWRPIGVAIAAVVFGAAMALQFVVQSLGWGIRYELVLMVPYLLTLLALVLFGRGSAPATLGRSADETSS